LHLLHPLLPALSAAAVVLANLVATFHAVLRKRDARAAIAWVGLLWLVPVLGVLLYFLFGINRIRRKAMAVHRDRRRFASDSVHEVNRDHPAVEGPLQALARAVGQVSGRPLVSGNAVTPLLDGETAYPAMLAAIDAAATSVCLCSFIFDNDVVGRRFLEALARAVRRGVTVRVLVDAVGAKYSFPPIHRALRRAGVPVARFLPTLAPAALPFANLRNHRKVMVVDGQVGFCGGMNIRAGHEANGGHRHPVRDVHFRFTGPIVAQLQDAFGEDWAFTTNEELADERFYPALAPVGPVAARVVTDGPDDDFETLHSVILAALAGAQRSVRIVTPYFLPNQSLISALATAALRGVEVEILLPSRGNIRLIDWACAGQLWQVLHPGCRVFASPPPFDHGKLMVVDRVWALVGSTNWDPRSLRLNFELNVECYCHTLASALDELIVQRIQGSRPITRAELDGRRLPAKLRDGLARLLSPYL
jgi:cardiolipin synthase A/B